MLGVILGILNGFLAVGSKILSYLSDEKLREAGRNERIILEMKEEVRSYEVAQEIDSKPTPSSKSGILKRL